MTIFSRIAHTRPVVSLRQAWAARAAHRALVRELDTYTTTTAIDDLLAALARDDAADTEVMRSILLAKRSHAA